MSDGESDGEAGRWSEDSDGEEAHMPEDPPEDDENDGAVVSSDSDSKRHLPEETAAVPEETAAAVDGASPRPTQAVQAQQAGSGGDFSDPASSSDDDQTDLESESDLSASIHGSNAKFGMSMTPPSAVTPPTSARGAPVVPPAVLDVNARSKVVEAEAEEQEEQEEQEEEEEEEERESDLQEPQSDDVSLPSNGPEGARVDGDEEKDHARQAQPKA